MQELPCLVLRNILDNACIDKESCAVVRATCREGRDCVDLSLLFNAKQDFFRRFKNVLEVSEEIEKNEENSEKLKRLSEIIDHLKIYCKVNFEKLDKFTFASKKKTYLELVLNKVKKEILHETMKEITKGIDPNKFLEESTNGHIVLLHEVHVDIEAIETKYKTHVDVLKWNIVWNLKRLYDILHVEKYKILQQSISDINGSGYIQYYKILQEAFEKNDPIEMFEALTNLPLKIKYIISMNIIGIEVFPNGNLPN